MSLLSAYGRADSSMKGITYLASDTKDHDLPVIVTDSLSEIAGFFGITKDSMSSMICRRQRIQGRYIVERVRVSFGSMED